MTCTPHLENTEMGAGRWVRVSFSSPDDSAAFFSLLHNQVTMMWTVTFCQPPLISGKALIRDVHPFGFSVPHCHQKYSRSRIMQLPCIAFWVPKLITKVLHCKWVYCLLGWVHSYTNNMQPTGHGLDIRIFPGCIQHSGRELDIPSSLAVYSPQAVSWTPLCLSTGPVRP